MIILNIIHSLNRSGVFSSCIILGGKKSKRRLIKFKRKTQLVLVLSTMASIQGSALAVTPVLANFKPFPLEDGINHMSGFTKDGREATILKAWRDNGGGNGFNVYVVTLPSKRSASASYNVVGFPGSSTRPVAELIYDEPHMKKDWVSAVVFGRGKVAGNTHTLMIRATRIWDTAIDEPAAVRFDIMKLAERNEGAGLTPEYFTPAIEGFLSTAKYCNAHMALNRELHIPLPPTYSGKHSRGGC
jgi:hypothetical protein